MLSLLSNPEESLHLAEHINSDPRLNLKGVCTHFPVSDSGDNTFTEFTEKQVSLLKDCVAGIRSAGVDPGIVHAANSGAIVGLSQSHLDMVRPGIMLYGYYPSNEQVRRLDIRPVMEFVTKVVFLKKVIIGKSNR